MSVTKAEIREKLEGWNRDWDQSCQALCWNLCNWFGHADMNYASANKAYRASNIVSRDSTKAPAGAWHYWDIGIFGHVAFALGNDLALMASSHVKTFWGNSGHNVGTITVTEYSEKTGARYLGWSQANGANDLTLITSKPKPPAKLKATQRRAAIDLNSRQSPLSTSKLVGTLPKGHIGEFDAYRHAEKVDGNDIWFRGTSGHWFWSGGLEDRGTHDLKNVTPLAPHQRKIDASGAMVWDTPFTGGKHIDNLKPGMTVTALAYTKGREHNKVTTWFQIGKTAWIWAGDCLDKGPHDLTLSTIKQS